MGLGAACGLLNGVLTTWGQVPALVVTLGTLYAFRGLAFLWTDGRQVNAETLPDPFLNIGTGTILGVPYLVLIALVVVLVVGQWLRDFRAGRELYAIGSNPEGARLAGVRSDRRVLTAFVLAGALAGLGGVLFTARFATVDATAGTGYELTVIAAAVVGGVAIFGGTGQRLRRRARRAAARHDHELADRPARRGVLAAGRDRRAAAARDRVRPAARRPHRGRPAAEERAPCKLSRPPPLRRRRRPPTPAPADRLRALAGRWETLLRRADPRHLRRRPGPLVGVPDHRLVHHRLARLLRGRADGAAARAGDHRRGDRPLGRVGARARRAR